MPAPRKPKSKFTRKVDSHGLDGDFEGRIATGSMRSMTAGLCAIHGLEGGFMSLIDDIVQKAIADAKGTTYVEGSLRESADYLVDVAHKKLNAE